MFFKRTVRPNMGLPSVSSGHQTGATCKCILNSIQSSTMARYTSLATETRLGQPERPRKNRTADLSKYFRLEVASDVNEQHALTRLSNQDQVSKLRSFPGAIAWRIQALFHVVSEIHFLLNRFFLRVFTVPDHLVDLEVHRVPDHLLPPVG